MSFSAVMAVPTEDEESYNKRNEALRESEYPMLKDVTYLDHAAMTLSPKSLMDRFAADMTTNLYGNPHSASPSSQLTTRRIDDIRWRVLRFFIADPDDFDVVFVANATAGVKLVMDAFRDSPAGFWYGYHKDSHTSLVGVREAASAGHRCFLSDEEVDEWLSAGRDVSGPSENGALQLFAYPAQSNMNGRRLPLDWSQRMRSSRPYESNRPFVLLDAAAFASTSQLDLSDPASAPDFTVLSFYKIFGFPDLGALIVRKALSEVLQQRNYFGGGTVDMVICLQESWHRTKSGAIHEQLEDGTLPIHSILSLDAAIDIQLQLFGSMNAVSRHTCRLAERLRNSLESLRHGNGAPVCQVHSERGATPGAEDGPGPIVAFNIRDRHGEWVSYTEVEKLLSLRNIHLRTGVLCNPGGTASALSLTAWEMRRNFSAGHRCGNDIGILNGKPTGVIRASFGACSTLKDVHALLSFVEEFFVDGLPEMTCPESPLVSFQHPTTSFHVESLTIYSIKSCAGWKVPSGKPWVIRKEGLEWDREWCLVHQGTGAVLSQKRYPKMALIRPSLDLKAGIMRVRIAGSETCPHLGSQEIKIPLAVSSNNFMEHCGPESMKRRSSRVCGDIIIAEMYTSASIASFFTSAVGVPCQLARFPPHGSGTSSRHSKAHLQRNRGSSRKPMPGAYPGGGYLDAEVENRILLSNESPVLMVSRSSLNRLNEQVKLGGGNAVNADVFRANVVFAEDLSLPLGTEQPFVEDSWRFVQIGQQIFQIMGPCRRCQMLCINQETGEKSEEPFVTLAKTRRFDGKVYFGQHMSHLPTKHGQVATISVGDPMHAYGEG